MGVEEVDESEDEDEDEKDDEDDDKTILVKDAVAQVGKSDKGTKGGKGTKNGKSDEDDDWDDDEYDDEDDGGWRKLTVIKATNHKDANKVSIPKGGVRRGNRVLN